MPRLDLFSGAMALVTMVAPLALVIYLLLVIDARRKEQPGRGR